MIVRYGPCFVEASTWPFGLLSARESPGSHVTATGTRPAANAAPASPEVMSVLLTSSSDIPCLSSTYASSHSLVEPSLTATFWPLSCEIELMSLFATTIGAYPIQVEKDMLIGATLDLFAAPPPDDFLLPPHPAAASTSTSAP